MARTALAVFAVVLAVAAIPVFRYLDKPRDVVASTPSTYTGGPVPIALPGHGEMCAGEMTFDPHAQVARFAATAKGRAPALEVVAEGDKEGPYANGYRSVTVVPGGWSGTQTIDARLQPAPRALFGRLCVLNRSDRAVELGGNELGRTNSRPTVTVNGKEVDTEFNLTLLEARPRSLLARIPAVFSHASTLRPFGAWWIWLLAIAVTALVPLGIALAMRGALAADERSGVAAAAADRPSALGVVRSRVGAAPGWAIVAVVAAAAFLYYLYWGASTHAFQNDEDQYVYLSRWLTHNFPAGLWDFTFYQRGLQRLEVWLLAIPAALLDSPQSLLAGRALNTVAFLSTSIPTYLLGRRLGLRPRWAAIPAVLSIVVPWAVVTTSFLTENLAYPAFVWVLWGTWTAAMRGGLRWDALALALVVVAGLSRTALLLLAVLPPLVVAAHDLRFGAGGARRRVRDSVRRHALLWGTAAAGVVLLLAAAAGVGPADSLVRRLAGGYGTPTSIDYGLWFDKLARSAAHIVVGTGFLAAVLAVPWTLRQLRRPSDEGSFTFAATCVAGVVVMAYGLHPASTDERYILYAAPPLLLAATLALARREVPAIGAAVTSVLLAVLLVRVPWNGQQDGFAFFTSPTEMFYARAVIERLSAILPFSSGALLTLVPLGLAAAGVAIAVAFRRTERARSAWPVTLVVAVVAVSMVVETQYAFSKYVNTAGNKSGPGLRLRAFADTYAPGSGPIATFAEGASANPLFFPIWQEIQFYNQRIEDVFTLGGTTIPVPLGDASLPGVRYDARTGRLTTPAPMPDYVVVTSMVGKVRLQGTVVYSSQYVPAQLMKIDRPARLAWRTSGLELGGDLQSRGPGRVRFYDPGTGPARECAGFELGAPPDAPVTWRLRAKGAPERHGRLAPGAAAKVTVRVPALATDGFADVTLSGSPTVRALGLAARC